MQSTFEIMNRIIVICCAVFISTISIPVMGQSGADQSSTPVQAPDHGKKKEKGPGHEMGQGGKDIGKGAAKGSMDLGKGAAGGAGDLVTGHPVDAGVSVGKGAVGFGKNVGVGAGKGTYKIGKGIGGLFRHHNKKSSSQD